MSDDGETVKWLWALDDDAHIETVLMHYRDRSTVCVSTQAGCAMACGFCATGQAGFERNLTTGEIVEQVIRGIRRSAPRRVSNVVFMGMGEPMANYDRTWSAIERLHGDVGISARHLTRIDRRDRARHPPPRDRGTAREPGRVVARGQRRPPQRVGADQPALSPRPRLTDACRDYLTAKNRRLSFEWALIDGDNDRLQRCA